jgi:hypothetical protein
MSADTTVTDPNNAGGNTGTTNTAYEPVQTGRTQSLSEWAGPYVTEMLGRGQALAEQPYQAYTGPLTAGASELQQQAFSGIGSLQMPTQQQMQFTPTQFTGGIAQQYMNPYLQAALEPQIAEARRQAEIQRMQNASRLSQAGAFGGSRQAVMEAAGNRDLLANLAGITGKGYASAFDLAQQQFNTEQDRQRAAAQQASDLAFKTLGTQAELGGIQRGIESEGIAADMAQFEQERLDPYKQVQFMQSLLQGMPLQTLSATYAQPTASQSFGGGVAGVLEIIDKLREYGILPPLTTGTTGTTDTTN